MADELSFDVVLKTDGRDMNTMTEAAVPFTDGLSAKENKRAHTVPLEFDENAYLAAYDDVILALDTAEFQTAQEHFDFHGRREGRLIDEKYLRAIGLGTGAAGDKQIEFNIDTIVCCRSGVLLIVGWTDDRESPLVDLLVSSVGRAWTTTAFGRVKRADVDAALSSARGHLFGFWSVVKVDEDISGREPWMIRGRLINGQSGQAKVAARVASEAELRSTILSYFASTTYYGNRDIECFLALEAGIGAGLVDLNRKITADVVSGAWVSYHGPSRKSFKASIIVCLFGKHEFLFLQSALFTIAPADTDYEFVYVSNSPELTEVLEKEARLCARIYGVSIVLVCLPNNAGFGAANNVAASFARSSRLLITNPDVFPRENNWLARHADIITSAPVEQTLMFGAPLYYDDGSLMHHGMFFEVDAGISVRPDGIISTPMIRTEHYGKGAPAWSQQFACPRPVPAVTGAFISADRNWFESLGGFNEDFLFGHYEDADLCLKSLARGKPVWLQNFPLWHMEGKGSTRQEAHEGGILVNRWLFTRMWSDLIVSELHGPEPSHAAFQAGPQPVAGRAAPRQLTVMQTLDYLTSSGSTPVAAQPPLTRRQRYRPQDVKNPDAVA